MSTGSQYVVAAYAVIWFVLLLWVAAGAMRTSRMARELELLTRLIERGDDGDTGPVAPAEPTPAASRGEGPS